MASIARKAAKCRNGHWRAPKFYDFQAEYEGSIPFTRSNDFNDLSNFWSSWYRRRSAARAWCTLAAPSVVWRPYQHLAVSQFGVAALSEAAI